ncbi:MAG: hypothetical protein PHN56_04805 [Candidatus Nanoarchaeia archaeon]|nr:hypothetical protein [Candidatus Nanoarchaeia archaeon]
MKAITPVISVILLIMLTIATSAAAFFFITSQVADLEAQGNLESFPGADTSILNLVSITGSKAIVRNDGSSPVNEVVMFVNGELLNYTLSTPIQPGEYKEITFNAREAGEDLEIKIIYNKGRSVTETSPANKNTENSGFTETPLLLNEINGDENIEDCGSNVWITGTITGTNGPCCGDDGILDNFYNGSLATTDHFCYNGNFVNQEIDDNSSLCENYEFIWIYGNIDLDYLGTSKCCGDDGDSQFYELFGNSTNCCLGNTLENMECRI